MLFKVIAFGGMALTLATDAAVLRVQGVEPVAMKVGGVPARVRIDPGAPTLPVFTADFAERAGFRFGWIGLSARVGPVRVPGKTAVIRFDLGSGEFKRRTSWFEAPFAEGADGTLGPGSLPAERIRFDLRPQQPGERTVDLPLASFGATGMGVRLPLGGQQLDVRFTLLRQRTLATATAGSTIASAQAGSFDGPSESMKVHFEVERPVRRMKLAKPLQIGPLTLTGITVRTSDFGGTAGIAEGAVAAPDPDEIVVVGQKKLKDLWLEIGRDDLDRCSSILFDKKRRIVTLSCR